MKMFLVAGIGLAVFIEFLLISKKNKTAPDKILVLWMFLIVVHLFLYYLFFSQEISNYPFLLGVEQPLPLLHGVLLYFYVSFLTRQLPEKRKVLVLHFLPAIAVYAYLIPFFFLPAEQKIEIYRNRGAGHELFNTLRAYAILLSGVIYVIWSALLLKRHSHNIREEFSDLEKVNLQWLRVLTLGLGGIWLLVILFRSDILTFAGVVAFIFLIGFFGIRQAEIFTPRRPAADGNPQKETDSQLAVPEEVSQSQAIADGIEPKKKYPKSGLTDELAGELHQRLIRLMTEEAPYKRSDLSITDLSSRLGVHPNYLSQVINQKERKNFYDFVNAYRIGEFKRLVAMPRNRQYTLLSLAYDCGFSSKSSFNRYFKEATGQTPSQYFATLTESQAVSS